ncbi:hypothetical protein RA224_12875 [Achromobacter aegrifaciens]|uniref:hypothetical protein n=1 Tax=Achromobacter aegrifaciens TaxID=1287736 RepID=UPI0027BB0044|nr:hypothetical protein [Achromobacter aegrifaciens]WLW64278.1 hypothetical protein RA224_12875 [Achromobacter aegrifaciens]
MNEINDGGPAFPNVPDSENWGNWDMGMTLRDYFAAKAMQAAEPPMFYIGTRETKESLKAWARHCWAMADAMLKARGDQ